MHAQCQSDLAGFRMKVSVNAGDLTPGRVNGVTCQEFDDQKSMRVAGIGSDVWVPR